MINITKYDKYDTNMDPFPAKQLLKKIKKYSFQIT